jgi:hypothetical protein
MILDFVEKEWRKLANPMDKTKLFSILFPKPTLNIPTYENDSTETDGSGSFISWPQQQGSIKISGYK